MSLQWNAELGDGLGARVAEGLLAAAIYFETQHKLRLNKSNPRPYHDSSAAGEYPRARTGAGRDGVTHQPATPADVTRNGFRLQIGYVQNVSYMAILEVYRDRLGLLKTLGDVLPQMEQIAIARSRGKAGGGP